MHPTIHFSMAFDGPTYTKQHKAGHHFIGEKGLLRLLEQQLGFSGYPENTDYFRIELYRQALAQHLQEHPEVFYAKSLEADRFATATALLARRDALLLSGFFEKLQTESAKLPPRLATFLALEKLFKIKIDAPENQAIACGFAGRFSQVIKAVQAGRPIFIDSFLLYDPIKLLPAHIGRFLECAGLLDNLKECAKITAKPSANSDLAHLQKSLSLEGKPVKKTPALDGSLLVLKTKSDADAAVFLSQVISKNTDYQPLILAPELNRTLEQAMISEGLPAPGVLSSSLARPSLQVLKLAPAFLWNPFDVHKVMEFVTLPLKPIDDGLAKKIASVMAEKPGMKSDTWFAAVLGYMSEHEDEEMLKEQYDFWFERRRFPMGQKAPKGDALSLFGRLYDWALSLIEKGQTTHEGIPTLVEQSRRIVELLRTLPEEKVDFLELERIVRTVYEPAPMKLCEPEKGALSVIHNQGALPEQPEKLLWWNCIFNETPPAPDAWRPEERTFLNGLNCAPDTPEQQATLRRYHRNKPVRMVQNQLVLVVPNRAEGADTQPPLIMGDIEAAFEGVHAIICDIDTEAGRQKLSKYWTVPQHISIESRAQQGAGQPILDIPNADLIPDAEYETFTNLDSLFHYPHKWFLKGKTKLYSTNLLTVKELNTLQGTLAHRFFEDLLEYDAFMEMQKNDVDAWIESRAQSLLEREGAVLLLYGLEPERQKLISRVKQSAWSLLESLRKNGWKVVKTELPLEGTFGGVPIRGKADVVLERGEESAILDLKWRGRSRRKSMIKSESDLQLVLYSYLLESKEPWPHTAFFIMEDGKLVARNTKAFKEAETAEKDEVDHIEAADRIFQKMECTFAWRMAQIKAGKLELRSERTATALEQLYTEAEVNLMELLELPNEDARWDDFGVLVQ